MGLDTYDRYPSLSAFLMAFHKYGLFALFCIFAAAITQLRVSNSNSTNTNTTAKEDEEDALLHDNSHNSNGNINILPLVANNISTNSTTLNAAASAWLSDAMSCALLLFFCLTNLGTWLMYWVVTRHHPHQQATAMTLLLGTVGTIYSLLMTAIAFRDQRRRISNIKERDSFILGGYSRDHTI